MLSLFGAALLVAGAPPQEPPARVKAIAVTAKEIRHEGKPRFHVEGTTLLPDEAVVTVGLNFHHANGMLPLAGQVVRARGGTFSIDLTIFPRDTFPGRYEVTATAALPQQPPAVHRWILRNGRLHEAPASIQVEVGTPEEQKGAAQRYRDELAGVFDSYDRIRRLILDYKTPGDARWNDSVRSWIAEAGTLAHAYQWRPENKIVEIGDPDATGFIPVVEALQNMCALRASKRPEAPRQIESLIAWIDDHRVRYLRSIGTVSLQVARARKLLEALAEALAPEQLERTLRDEDKVRQCETQLLEMGTAVQSQAYAALQDMAGFLAHPEKTSVGDRVKRAAELLNALRRGLVEPDPTPVPRGS